jgi:ATP synthase protein I
MEDRRDPQDKSRDNSSQKHGSSQDLDVRLKAARKRIGQKKEPERAPRSSELGMAMRVAVDLVVGVFMGTFIGIGLDYWLGTGPWLLILFFVLGSAAGIRNVIKTADEMTKRPRGNGSSEDGES